MLSPEVFLFTALDREQPNTRVSYAVGASLLEKLRNEFCVELAGSFPPPANPCHIPPRTSLLALPGNKKPPAAGRWKVSPAGKLVVVVDLLFSCDIILRVK